MTEIDWYALCKAGLIARLRTLTTLFPKAYQVSDNDDEINRGADYWIFVMTDTFPSTRIDGNSNFYNWNIELDLGVRYTTKAQALQRFDAARGKLINLLTPYCLNDINNVMRTVVSSNSKVMQDTPADEKPNFIFQTLLATITQRVTFKP
jgi:hypothetical protein